MRIRAFVVSGGLIHQFEATVFRGTSRDLILFEMSLDEPAGIGERRIRPPTTSISVHRYRPKI